MQIRIKSIFFCALLLLLGACNDNSGSASTPVPATRELYVSLPAADAIERIRLADGAVLQRSVVGMLPHNLLLSRDGTKLYVVLVGSQAVAELDVQSGVMLRTMLTAPVPERRADGSLIQAHIDQNAFAHTTCFDCHSGGANAAKPTVVGTRPLGITWHPSGDALLVTNSRGSTLVKLELATGAITETITLAPAADAHDPVSLAVAGNRGVLALRPTQPSLLPSVVRVMNMDDFSVVHEYTAGTNASHVAIDVSGQFAYVSNFDSNTVMRIALADGRQDILTVGDGPLGVRVAKNFDVISANFYENSVSVLDHDGGVIAHVPLRVDDVAYSNPTHLALDNDGRKAYVVSGGTQGHVLELDLDSLQFTRALAIGGLPFDVVAVPVADVLK